MMEDLDGFREIRYFLAHLSISFKAIWNIRAPEVKEGVCSRRARSSAKRTVFSAGCWGISWKYRLNRKGARMLPCGTPDVIGKDLDRMLLILTE